MSVVHVLFLSLAAMAGIATMAAGSTLRRTSGGVQLQLVGVVLAMALVVGNAVCALPGTPAWYSMVLLTATAAGLAWLVTTLAGALRRGAAMRPVSGIVVPGALATPQPLATVHRLHDVRMRAASGPDVVTAGDLYQASPRGSRDAASGAVYVAANLGAYVAPSPIERRNRVLRAQQRRDPIDSMRRLRVAQAYNHTPQREARIRRSL